MIVHSGQTRGFQLRLPSYSVWLMCGLVSLLLGVSPTAAAADDQAAFLTKLFMAACVPNMGNPDGVRAWAAAHRLNQIQAAAPLGVFVGPGDKGAAWAVPTTVGNFALSIRGKTQACAVWAQAADPDQVEIYFKKLIEGVGRPGVNIRADSDTTQETSAGHAHVLAYNIRAPGASASFEFTMIAAERSNPAFQASIQVAKASAN